MVTRVDQSPGAGVRLARLWIPLLMGVGGALMVGLFTTAQWREARNNAEREARHDFAEMMANVQGGIIYLQRQSDLVGIQTMIANQGFDPHLKFLLAVDGRGKIFASTRLAWVDQRVNEVAAPLNRMLATCQGRRWRSETVHDAAAASLYSCHPITVNPLPTGAALLGTSHFLLAWYDYSTSVQANERQATQRAVMVWLSFGGGWLALTLLLRRALDRRRIGKLIATTERFSAGELTARIGGDARDEIGLIGQAVDRMAGELEAASHALDHSRAELETRVEQRTAELQKANQVLEREIKIRLQTERSLEDSRRFFETVLDAQSVHIGVLDADGHILIVNESWRCFGAINVWSGENLGVGQNYLATCDVASERGNPHARALAQGIREVIAGSQPEFHFEYPCPDPSGQKLFIVHVTRIPDGDKRQVVVVHEDVTQQKRAEQAVRRNEAWLRSLIETTQDAVVSIDRNGNIVLFNAAAERMFGYNAAEVQGQQVTILMDQPYASEHANYIERYERTRERQAIGRIRTVMARKRNGEPFPIELSVTEVAADDEVRYAAFIRDITEKSRLQEQLIESERLAVLGGAAAKIGHEIANPINGMLLTMQLLEQQLAKTNPSGNGQITSNLSKLKNEISRLNRLVGQFRTISRKEAYEFRPTDFVSLVEDVSASQQALCASLGIKIVHRFPPEVVEVLVDRDKIKQALHNLYKNAIEAMPDGGVLTVSQKRVEQGLCIEVSDTGAGIPTGLDIFAPFVTSKGEGTGIGLVIVRQIVTAHWGSISYQSEPQKGTVFMILLPLQ